MVTSEVTKPETINYRTLRPEKDGLFVNEFLALPKIGTVVVENTKKFDLGGIICDRCGVEVVRQKYVENVWVISIWLLLLLIYGFQKEHQVG